MSALNIVLIGLRGSGKTTVGRLVAERLARPFVDLDDATALSLGAARVAEAWTKHGEKAFRRAEAAALAAAMAGDGRVIALGGGTPTAPGAADLLRREREAGRSRVVYLEADAPTLRARLAASDLSTRPSLTGADPLAEIDAVLAQRDPLFREIADDVIETGAMTIEVAADEVVRAAS
ncbi:MAG: shikimate kinase [Phycisphaerales bacterium]